MKRLNSWCKETKYSFDEVTPVQYIQDEIWYYKLTQLEKEHIIKTTRQ